MKREKDTEERNMIKYIALDSWRWKIKLYSRQIAGYPYYVVAKYLIKQGLQDKREAGEFSKTGEGQIVRK